jgi:hypothetical protein
MERLELPEGIAGTAPQSTFLHAGRMPRGLELPEIARTALQ